MFNFNGNYNINTSICYGDKSISHRALILAAIAKRPSTIHNLSRCDDVQSTIACLRTLGADIRRLTDNCVQVSPIARLPQGEVTLDCGNSGTTARLLAGLVAGLGVSARFVGDESLTKRPMDRVLQPLAALGAKFTKPDGCLFAIQKSHLSGAKLTAKVNSAQVKSAVLLAGLFADGETTYIENIATRNHTELMLAHCGADIAVCGNATTVKHSEIDCINCTLPNDPSSAAYLVALALVTGQSITLPNVLLNERRMGFYRVLQRSGADITFINTREIFGEKAGDIYVKPGKLTPLYAYETDVCDGVDEIPLLATVAFTVAGTHTFCKVAELQYKESNRVKAIECLAQTCLQTCNFDGTNLQIISNGIVPKDKFFFSFGDHRIAMCAAVLCLAYGGGSVDNPQFSISLPQFVDMVGVQPTRLALIGESVASSKSPYLMSHLARKANVCCSYQTVSITPSKLATDLPQILSTYHGFNVTMPYKRNFAQWLSATTPTVNTVWQGGNATSTDGYGIVESLRQHGVTLQDMPLWVVGAGGASEACIIELLKYGCKVQVINRTYENALKLTQKYNLCKQIDNPVGILSFVPECEFEQQLVLPDSVQFVFVAAYKGQSGLRNQAIARGITYVDGLEMLYHQGAMSFSIWTGTKLQNDYGSFVSEMHKLGVI